jgi:hypothetical protein
VEDLKARQETHASGNLNFYFSTRVARLCSLPNDIPARESREEEAACKRGNFAGNPRERTACILSECLQVSNPVGVVQPGALERKGFTLAFPPASL